MSPSEACIALVKEFEGCKLNAYLCPAHVPTIGFGATGPDVRMGMTWTQAQADARLEVDLNRFAQGVTASIGPHPTTQGQFDAMTAFAFNVGLENFKRSTLLRKHQDGDKVGAALQFARWNKAAGKVLPGLTRRRAAEAALYRG